MTTKKSTTAKLSKASRLALLQADTSRLEQDIHAFAERCRPHGQRGLAELEYLCAEIDSLCRAFINDAKRVGREIESEAKRLKLDNPRRKHRA